MFTFLHSFCDVDVHVDIFILYRLSVNEWHRRTRPGSRRSDVSSYKRRRMAGIGDASNGVHDSIYLPFVQRTIAGPLFGTYSTSFCNLIHLDLLIDVDSILSYFYLFGTSSSMLHPKM